MTQRNPVTTGLLALFVPFYSLWWMIVTKREMNAKYGTKVPTAWVLLIPFIGPLWFIFSWLGAASRVHQKFSPVVGFFIFMVPFLGYYMHQGGFNEAGQRGGGGGMAMQQAR